MLALTRFRSSTEPGPAVAEAFLHLRETLRRREGCVDVTVGLAMDDPTLWVLVSRWQDVRSYRRTLSAVDVRVAMAAVTAWALDEPGSFELVGEGVPLARASDATQVGLGEAAAPSVPTDLDPRG